MRDDLDVDLLWQRALRLAGQWSAATAPCRTDQRALLHGLHAQRRPGAGDSFWQFRPYERHEPALLIDWRRSARSDDLYVRERERELSRGIWLFVDLSPSMRFRSSPDIDSKAARAVLIALAAAKLLVDAGERIALLGVHRRAAAGRFGLERLRVGMHALSRETARSGGTLPDPGALPEHARILMFGDFLDGQESLSAMFGRAIARRIDGHLLQICDPVEEDFPFRGRARFEGCEGEDPLLLDRAEDLAADYRRRMAAHGTVLRDLAAHAGWTCGRHRTDRSAGPALLATMAPGDAHRP